MNTTSLPTEPTLDPRERLLDAAEELFATRGYDAATVRDICDRAGMNVAAINYHFGDKQRLYVETLKRAHSCADDARGEPFPDWSPETLPVQRLRDFIRVMVSRMHMPARSTAMQLLMREMAHPSPAGAEIILEYMQPKAFILRGVLAELFPAIEPQRLLMIGFSVIGQILFYRQNRPAAELIFGKERVDELDAATVAEHVTRFTLAALGQAEPYPTSGGAS